MKARLIKIWESRSPRDRIIIGVLAVAVGVLLYVALVQSAQRARAQLSSSLQVLRERALQMDSDANELVRVRAAPAVPVAKTDLRTQLQTQAGVAGFERAVVRMDARDANQVRVVFGSVAFADWLTWVASLQAQHIRIDAGRIEALSTPGLVSVTATFVRAKPK